MTKPFDILPLDWTTEGAWSPLFSWLCSKDIPPVLEGETLHTSVEENLLRIFSTRASWPIKTYLNWMHNPTTQGFIGLYGIPDFSAYDGNSNSGWLLLEEVLTLAVSAYEPRLQDTKVKILSYDKKSQDILVNIQALLVVGKIVEPWVFERALKLSS